MIIFFTIILKPKSNTPYYSHCHITPSKFKLYIFLEIKESK